MDESRQTVSEPQELRRHTARIMLVLLLAAVLIFLSVFTAIRKLDPTGVYVFSYELSPEGEIGYGKETEIHLLDDGRVKFVFESGHVFGTWEKDGKTVSVRVGNQSQTYRLNGDRLLEKHDDGGVTCYRKRD